ncbi:MAG: cytosine permease [Gemmatimonadales bacterium]
MALLSEMTSPADYADQESRYGIVPILRSGRIYSLVDLAFVAGSYATATWCFVHGAALAAQMSLPQSIMSTFGAGLSFVLLICLIGLMSNKYGIDHWLLSRAVWGPTGTSVILITVLTASWGWGAINAQMFGESLSKLIGAAGVDVSSPWWVKGLSLVCIGLGFLIALRGTGAVRRASWIMGLLLLAVGAVVAVLVFQSPDLGAAWRSGPLTPVPSGEARTAYMIGTEWNVAFMLSWFPVIGALTRLARGPRAAHWGLWLGYGAMMAAYVLIGVAVAHVAAAGGSTVSGDPTTYLLELGGPWLGSLTLVLVGVANVSTTAVGLYGTAISTKVLWPTWRYQHVMGFWALFVAVLTLWGGVWSYYSVFLAVMGIVNGPAVGLLIVDYWVLRRQRLDLRSIFEPGSYQYTGGINLVALASFAMGVVAFLLVFDPIAIVVRSPSIFNSLTATGVATVVAALSYAMMARVAPIRAYLLRDRVSSSPLC